MKEKDVLYNKNHDELTLEYLSLSAKTKISSFRLKSDFSVGVNLLIALYTRSSVTTSTAPSDFSYIFKK